MHDCKSPRWLVSFLILICLVATPAVIESQCMVATTMASTAGATINVYKILSAPYNCGTTMMNAIFCTPTAAITTSFLGATANTTMTAAPSCAWACACGAVTIDGSDGLPVELMDFGFEEDGGQSAEGAEQGS